MATRTLGIAAKNYKEDAVRTLREWAATSDGAYFTDLEAVLDARVY
jgi:hypothetical protein